jgi:hypothetical protein
MIIVVVIVVVTTTIIMVVITIINNCDKNSNNYDKNSDNNQNDFGIMYFDILIIFLFNLTFSTKKFVLFL